MLRRQRVNGYRYFVWVARNGRTRIVSHARALVWIASGAVKRGHDANGRIVYRRVAGVAKKAA